MIAANYIKHPEAMAIQLPLPFGRLLKWAAKRPGSRVLRSIRAARAAAFKKAGRIKYPEIKKRPLWAVKLAEQNRQLAKEIKEACLALC